MSLEHTINHVSAACARLISPFRGQPNMEAHLSSYIRQVQEIEDAIYHVLTLRWVDTATGAQLDVLGRIVGVERLGLLDDQYRIRILARISNNVSKGVPDDMLALLRLLTGQTSEIEEQYPAAFVMRSPDVMTLDGDVITGELNKSKPAGVRMIYEWHPVDPGFCFANGDGAGFGAGTWANARRGVSS